MKVYKIYNVSQFSSSQNWKHSSLQHLLKNVLVIAQFFAILPVNGITKDAEHLKFKWISIKMLYAIFTIALITFNIICLLSYCIYNSDNFISYVIVVWNVRALIGIIFLIRLARKWPLLLQQWTAMEKNMFNHGPLMNLKLRFRITSFVFFITGFAEHALYTYGGIRSTIGAIGNNENFIQKYFEMLYTEFFHFIPYSHLMAAIVQFTVIITTFNWQMCDLLLVLLSSTLALRFQQISKMIKLKSQILNEAEWRELRKQYNGLALLCRLSNNTLAEIILLSFFGNACFLSTTIFQCFTVNTKYELFYYWYTAAFNFFHLLIVCIYASWVHEESLEPISEISSVPTKNMSHEIDRMLYQIATKDIAIYGGGLFKVTRGVILNIMSAVVTIQLIFVQFNAKFLSKIE